MTDGEHARDLEAARARVSQVVLERYKLDGLRGVGGFAAVYAAHDVHTKQVVAVKLLHPSLALDHTASARFARESRITRWLTHPAIPRGITAGVDPTHGLALVMDFVAGVDLGTRLKQHGPLPLADALRLGARAAEALDAAHAAGIVHRDVKPENLLLVDGATAPDALRLVDFGLAFCVDATRLTQWKTIEGSPCYLAPEQIEGASVTHATDVYALGATLVAMLTGRPPFEGGYLQQLTAHMTLAAPSLRAARPDVPEVVDRFVLRMLDKDPRRRPSSAAGVAERLAEFASWFEEQDRPPNDAEVVTAPAPVATSETAVELIEEIQRLSERLHAARASAVAAHGRIVEQLVELTSRQLLRDALRRERESWTHDAARLGAIDARLTALGDATRDAQREAAIESALERMEEQSRQGQGQLLASLRDLEQRLTTLR